MLFDRWFNQSDNKFVQHIRHLFQQPQENPLTYSSPGSRTMRLAYLSHARERIQNGRTTHSLPAYLPVPLAEGIDLFVPSFAPGMGQALDLITHFRGGTPQIFAKMNVPALIVRADTPGLAGAMQKRFGKQHWVQQTREAVLQACWKEWRWLPILDRQILSSFGAGYAPLAAALEQELVVHQTDAVFVLDGIHYGRPGKPDRESHEPFLRFAKLAARGHKLMVMSHTSIQPPFASAADAANYLSRQVKARRSLLDPALADDWNPASRADIGNFHVESYPGQSAESHIAQIQQMGHLWGRYLDLSAQSAGQFRA